MPTAARQLHLFKSRRQRGTYSEYLFCRRSTRRAYQKDHIALMASASSWIAVVDDDPGVLKALSRLLRTRGFRVETYGSGQEFVAGLPAGRPECLIVDLRMPDMNGEALRQYLVDSGIKIPTIFLTADGDDTLHERNGEGDVIGTLRKPVLEKALFSMIGRVMGGPGSTVSITE